MLKLNVSNKASKFLSTREPKHQRQIAAKIAELLDDSRPNDSITLKGSDEGYRRADIGEYRIIYLVDSDILHVDYIGKRNDDEVYKKAAKK